MGDRFYMTIRGGYGAGNLGDDLLLFGLLASLRGRVADKDICVLTTKPADYLSERYPNIRFLAVKNMGRIRTTYFLYGGGTQFFSFPNTRTSWAGRFRLLLRARNISKVWGRLKRLAHPSSIISERTGAISIGIGPFVPGSVEIERARSILAACDWISVRDTTCERYLKEWGIGGFEVHSDLVYAKDLWLDKGVLRNAPRKTEGAVGIIVRDWPHSEAGRVYFHALHESVKRMRNEGLSVQYICFSREYDVKTQSFLEGHGEQILKWDPCRDSPAGFVTQLSAFDLLVTARAHGVVLGSVLGIPSIAIEIEPKLTAIRQGVENGTSTWAPPFDPEDLLVKVRDVMRKREGLSKSLRQAAGQCESDAKASLSSLLAWLGLLSE